MNNYKFILLFLIIIGITLVSVAQGILNAAGKNHPTSQFNQEHKIVIYFPCILYYMGTPTPTDSPLPDLMVSGLGQVHYGCAWDQPGYLSGQIRNQGDAPAGSFFVDINAVSIPVTSLTENDEVLVTVDIGPGHVPAVRVYADSKQQVHESNENNNVLQIMYTPPLPCTSVPTPTPTETGD
jgi:hypothetical protein